MVLVLFLLGMFVFFLCLFFLIVMSDLKIKIKKLELKNTIELKRFYDYEIEIGLYLFEKIKYFRTKINKTKLKKLNIQKALKKINIKQDVKLNTDTINKLKILSPKIESLELNLQIGTENTIYTSFAIFIISTAISILLPHIVEYKNYGKIKYELIPVYTGESTFSINLNGIICLKMAHIINIIYTVLQKRRDEENERTSNRRAYAHGYE